MTRLLIVVLLLVFAAPPVALADKPPCDSPRLFKPNQPIMKWHRKRTRMITVRSGSARHRGQDVITTTGRDQLLIAKFAYGKTDKDLTREHVDVFVQDAPPCGQGRRLGDAWTSDGDKPTRAGVEDDGGRVYFSVPEAHRRGEGQHPVRMLVGGDHSQAAFGLYVTKPATRVVIFDMDGTLTTGDGEIGRQLFKRLSRESYRPKMYKGAPAVARSWAAKGYLVVYVSGRPDNLRRMSRKWLVEQGFPPGPIHLTDKLRQSRPSSGGLGEYKSDFLKRLESEGLVVYAAYGNAETDIEAYEAAGVPKSHTFIIGPNAGKGGTVGITSYGDHLAAAKAMRSAEVRAPSNLRW